MSGVSGAREEGQVMAHGAGERNWVPLQFPCHPQGFLLHSEPVGCRTLCYLSSWKSTFTETWRIAWRQFRLKTLMDRNSAQKDFPVPFSMPRVPSAFGKDVVVLAVFYDLAQMRPLSDIFLDLSCIQGLSPNYSPNSLPLPPTLLSLSLSPFFQLLNYDGLRATSLIRKNIKREKPLNKYLQDWNFLLCFQKIDLY